MSKYPVKRLQKVLGIILAALIVAIAAPAARADSYTMELTGVGDGAVADGVYVSPYQGTISLGGTQIYSGYVICDDFLDEAYLSDPWSASSTNAGSLNGTELFTTSSSGYTVQQNYDAVAWLANGLLSPSNVTNPIAQVNYSFAIWDIMDGATTNPDGGTAALISEAFAAVEGGSVGTDVTVFTPDPKEPVGSNVSQEFLVVGAPVNTPEPGTIALTLSGIALLGLMVLMQKRTLRTLPEAN
jgi:hypothetical protein